MAQDRRAYFGVEYELDPSDFLFHGEPKNSVRWDNVALYAGYFNDQYNSEELFTNFGEYSDGNYSDGNYPVLKASAPLVEQVLTRDLDRFLFGTVGFRITIGSNYAAKGIRWYFLMDGEAIFYGAPHSERSVTYINSYGDVVTDKWSFPKFQYQGWGITLLGFRLIVPVSCVKISWTSRLTLPHVKEQDNGDMPYVTWLSSTIGVEF